MAKPDQQRVSQRTVLDPVSTPANLQVVARATDQTVLPGDSPLAGIAAGLASLNPKLTEYLKQKNTTDALDAEKAGMQQRQKEDLAGMDPTAAINSPISMPEAINPAFRKNFERGYREVLGVRVADGVSDDMLTEWAKIRHTEQDPEKFIREWTVKNTAGFTDPELLTAVTKRHVETVKAIRSDARGLQIKAMEESARNSVSAAYSTITPDMSNEQMFAQFNNIVAPAGLGTGLYTRPELAVKFLERLNALSLSQNGSPEVFSAMVDYKDPTTGKSLVELNPALAVQVESYRRAAEQQRDGRLEKAMRTVNFQKTVQWDERVARGEMPRDEDYKSEIGPLGMFQTEEAALARRRQDQKTVDGIRAAVQGQAMANAGLLWAVAKPEDQKKIMDARTDGFVGALMGTINSTDPQSAAVRNQSVEMIVKAHRDSGANIPNTRLKNFFGSIAQQFPATGAEPPAHFIAAAQWYSQMPANLKAVYADGDAAMVLEQYQELRSNGAETQLDAKSAYHQAYAAISPEAKARAVEIAKNPEFNAKINGMVKNLTTSGWRDVFGFEAFGTYPTNEPAVAEYAQREAKQFLMRNPNAGEGALKSHVQKWYAGRFVYEPQSNLVVEVPGGDTGAGTVTALSEFVGDLRKKYPDSNPELRHVGSGVYQVWALNGTKMLETGVRLSDLKEQSYFRKHLNDKAGEGGRMAALQQSLLAGTATLDAVTQEADLIAKAKTLGLWSPEMDKRVDRLRRDSFRKDTDALMQDIPPTTNDNLGFANEKSTGRAMTDVAASYWDRGRSGQALTVMSEGVRLKAYKDNIGTAIGVGYNMDMNAKTISEDFRRAGIPAEQIDAIKAGTVTISNEQAMRLFDISYFRAEETARLGIDKIYGKGAWAKLPANKKAVIVDVSYQAGSITKFPTALGHLMNGEDAVVGNPKVHYRKDGKMIPDTPRNNLRFKMLSGEGQFGTVIDEVARKPRNVIEAKQLTAAQQ